MACGRHLPFALAICAVCINSDCISPRNGLKELVLCPTSNFSQSTGRRLARGDPRPSKVDKPDSNSRLKMFVKPTFVMWSGLDFAHGQAQGIMSLEQFWSNKADSYFSEAETGSIVRIMNFNGGSVVEQPIVPLGKGERVTYQMRRQFEGNFKQSFDVTCFPFDKQDVSFEIVIEKPISEFFDLFLLCNRGDISRGVNGDVVPLGQAGPPTNAETAQVPLIQSCTKSSSAAVGFIWDDFVCTRHDESTIKCSMTGARLQTRTVLNFLLPSIMVSMMSFTSFHLHASSAMPRIAATMIAMLAQINLKAELAKSLPGSGHLSWMEIYFTSSTVFMFFNLCCHVAAIKAYKMNHINVSDFVDDIGCGVSLSLFMIIPSVQLVTSGCTGAPVASGWSVAVIGFLLMFVLTGKAFATKRESFMEWVAERESLKEELASRASAVAMGSVGSRVIGCQETE